MAVLGLEDDDPARAVDHGVARCDEARRMHAAEAHRRSVRPLTGAGGKLA